MTQEQKDLFNERISLIREAGELSYRHSGRTTKLVDEYIQKLYNNQGKWVDIYDHYEGHAANYMILRIIIARMEAEHHADKFEVCRGAKYPKIRLISCSRDRIMDRLEEIRKRLRELAD